jgi:hypothetical protein
MTLKAKQGNTSFSETPVPLYYQFSNWGYQLSIDLDSKCLIKA